MTEHKRPLSSEPPTDASEINITSGVGAASRLGYVNLRWGPKSGQLTTSEARRHAFAILDAAAAADHDAAVFRWMTERMKTPDDLAAAALIDIRAARIANDTKGDDR